MYFWAFFNLVFQRNTSYLQAKQPRDLIDRDMEQKRALVKQEEAASGLLCHLDTQKVGKVYAAGWNSPEDTKGKRVQDLIKPLFIISPG